MSKSFINRDLQKSTDNNQSETNQKKIDPVAQAKWMNSLNANSGWGISQMFAQEEEEQVQGKFAEDEELQMKTGDDSSIVKSGSLGTKTSIPDDVQNKMEYSFGIDFSDVKIQMNSEQANNMGASAYSQGNNVHFAPGQFNPNSTKGQELLGHELTHVVQQRQGRVRPTKQGKGLQINDNPSLEKEADKMGAKAAQGKMVDVVGKGSGVQRQADESVNTETDPIDKILQAVAFYRTGFYTMPQLARAVLPYVEKYSSKINDIFSILDWDEKDNFAYALAFNSTEFLKFSDDLLSTMSNALDTMLTYSSDENSEQKKRIDDVLAYKATPEGKLEILLNKNILTQEEVAEAKTQIKLIEKSKRGEYSKKLLPLEAASDREKVTETFNDNITDNVGSNKTNAVEDVKKVAKGLVANGYTVNEISIANGICDSSMIEAIKSFEKDKLGRKPSKGQVKGYLTPGCWTGDYDLIYGTASSSLNSSLNEWKRVESFNNTTNLTNYTINDSGFIERGTYDTHVNSIAEDKEIETASDDGKALAIAAKAAKEEKYFEEFTKNVIATLNLSNESVESHQLNPILKDRLGRFHKFLLAVGLFNGNMTGGACRSAKFAHKIAIPHVVMGGERPASSVDSIRNNLINVFNGDSVTGGSKDSSSNIKDTDGNIWAKDGHFNKDAEGKATSMNDSVWFTHLETFQPGRNWSTLTAEGYKRQDSKRFPLGLDKSPGRSNHITGDAIDVNSNGFLNKNDTRIDIIALYFGLSRPVPNEQWHFEPTNLGLSPNEAEIVNDSQRNSLTT